MVTRFEESLEKVLSTGASVHLNFRVKLSGSYYRLLIKHEQYDFEQIITAPTLDQTTEELDTIFSWIEDLENKEIENEK